MRDVADSKMRTTPFITKNWMNLHGQLGDYEEVKGTIQFI